MSRRRRRRPRSRSGFVPPAVIAGLADAITTASALADRYPHAHAAVITDDGGRVLDMWVCRGQQHTAEDAIRAGLAGASRRPVARRAVLVSVMEGVDLFTPNELEVEMWHAIVERFSRAGLLLWEWVLVSGDIVRSLAVTAETERSWRSG